MKITTVHYGLANSLVFESIIFVFQNFSGIPAADETRHKRGKLKRTHLALSGSGLELLIRLAAMEMLQFPGRQHGYHDGPLPEIYHFCSFLSSLYISIWAEDPSRSVVLGSRRSSNRASEQGHA